MDPITSYALLYLAWVSLFKTVIFCLQTDVEFITLSTYCTPTSTHVYKIRVNTILILFDAGVLFHTDTLVELNSWKVFDTRSEFINLHHLSWIKL